MSLLQELEALIGPQQRATVPSISLALLSDGEVSTHIITQGAEDSETAYQSCSISKAITALATMKLIDESRLSLDSRITDYLPREIIDLMIVPSTSHLMQHITIAMLLSHTSGLSQGPFPGYPGDAARTEHILSGDKPSKTAKVHLISFPGAQLRYSGGGFLVLQKVLEQVVRKPFHEIMRETVLQPLDMRRSHYGGLSPEEKNYARAHWTANTPCEAEYHDFPELAAAGLWSTPTDLLKAAAAIQSSLHTDNGFLRQETARKMLTIVKRSSLGGVGLGWFANEDVFTHTGGNDPGFTCFVIGFHGGTVNQSSDAGVTRIVVKPTNAMAAMTNSVLGFSTLQKILGAVYYLQGWPYHGLLTGGFKSDYVPFAATPGTPVNEAWRGWAGTWTDGWKLLDDNGPALTYKTLPAIVLRPAAVPARKDSQGRQSIDLVADGLEVALRLCWVEGDVRVIELMQEELAVLHKIDARNSDT